jgi:hypothetical protein
MSKFKDAFTALATEKRMKKNVIGPVANSLNIAEHLNAPHVILSDGTPVEIDDYLDSLKNTQPDLFEKLQYQDMAAADKAEFIGQHGYDEFTKLVRKNKGGNGSDVRAWDTSRKVQYIKTYGLESFKNKLKSK